MDRAVGRVVSNRWSMAIRIVWRTWLRSTRSGPAVGGADSAGLNELVAVERATH